MFRLRAAKYYDQLIADQPDITFEDLESDFIQHFTPAQERDIMLNRLSMRYQNQEETVDDFADDLLRMVERAYNQPDVQKETLRHTFIYHSKPEIRKVLLMADSTAVSTFDKALAVAQRIESCSDIFQKDTNIESQPQKEEKKSVNTLEAEISALKEQLEEKQSVNAVTAQHSSDQTLQKLTASFDRLCTELRSQAVHAPQSTVPQYHHPQTNRYNDNRGSNYPNNRNLSTMTCFGCGGRGHMRRACPSRFGSHNQNDARAPQVPANSNVQPHQGN